MEFFSLGNIIVYIDKFIKFINSIFFVILIIVRIIYLLSILFIFSCKYEKYEPATSTSPLAECIDGHAKFTLNGQEYEYECNGYDLMGYVSLDEMNAESGNDCWGWTDSQTGKEYALVGMSNGTSFVDISNPENPVYIGRLPTQTNNSSWRDLKVYQDHVFIVSEASGHGMQVFDLTQLRTYSGSPITFSHSAHYNEFGNATAIEGDTIVIGSHQSDNGGFYVDYTGSAYIYTRSGTSWTQVKKIQSSDIQAGDNFGKSVAIYLSLIHI